MGFWTPCWANIIMHTFAFTGLPCSHGKEFELCLLEHLVRVIIAEVVAAVRVREDLHT